MKENEEAIKKSKEDAARKVIEEILVKCENTKELETQPDNEIGEKDTVQMHGIGRLVKFARNRTRISKQVLAEQCNISTHLLSDIENGYVMPTFEMISKVARTTGLPIAFFDPSEETAEEKKILTLYATLTKRKRVFIIELMKRLDELHLNL